MFTSYNLIAIIGPTAVGKTSIASRLAYEIDGEIISADSRQVYRGMTLGTGKDLDDYCIEGYSIPYHLIDILDAGYQYNVFEYQKDFIKVYHDIVSKGKTPILCGGSGLYVQAVLEGYKLISVPPDEQLRSLLDTKTDEELVTMLSSMKKLHNHTDTETRKRLIRAIEIEIYYQQHPFSDNSYPELSPLIIGINVDREIRRQRITDRLQQRLDSGMVEEVQTLLDSGLTPAQIEYYGLEYKYLVQYLTKQLTYNEMFNGLNTAIHQFAKRQMTWFRRMERNGHNIHWIDGTKPLQDIISEVITLFNS